MKCYRIFNKMCLSINFYSNLNLMFDSFTLITVERDLNTKGEYENKFLVVKKMEA